MSSLNWGAVAVGAVAGLAAGIVLAIPLLALGVAGTDDFGGQAALILLGFVAQFLAGYVAARIAGFADAQHGSLSALGLFAVVAGISIAAGQDPSIGTLAFSGVVALVLGTAGGVLGREVAEAREHRAGD
ncbi:MAG: hypothetical protein R3290_09050 [Acidimicrobiia bacterium]|nr:hypothetical protein [Acidimicrobiia bacterium]